MQTSVVARRVLVFRPMLLLAYFKRTPDSPPSATASEMYMIEGRFFRKHDGDATMTEISQTQARVLLTYPAAAVDLQRDITPDGENLIDLLWRE